MHKKLQIRSLGDIDIFPLVQALGQEPLLLWLHCSLAGGLDGRQPCRNIRGQMWGTKETSQKEDVKFETGSIKV